MTKFNKSLLTAAVVGALALPGLASAATLNYSTGKQITYAKDLFVNETISIDTPRNLRLTAEASDNELARIDNIAAGEILTVKVTLDNNAQFDSTATAETLVQTFTEGTQSGGAGGAIAYQAGTANYNGSELNFKYAAGAAGGDVTGDYFIELNSAKVKNLITGLYEGNQVAAEITVQNAAGQQILAARRIIARSAWGVTVVSDATGINDAVNGIFVAPGEDDKYIDVGADPRKTLFGNLAVGSSAALGTASGYFQAGGFNINITRALETTGPGATAPGTFINNFSAVAANPDYNIVNTAVFTLTVAGSDLASFSDGNAWVSNDATCLGGANAIAANAALNSGNLVFSLPVNNAIFTPVNNAGPTGPGVNLYVCLGGNGEDEIIPQSLTGSLALNYNLATQRVNPAPWAIDLLPLQLNGTTLLFQNVNPAANGAAQSFLRLTNNNAFECPIAIDAKDDAGLHTGNVEFTLGAHQSIHINSDDLENGNAAKGLTGAWGDGSGRWYVRVTAECSNLAGSALNRNTSTGVVTDLTPAKAETWLTPTDKL